MTTRPLIPSDTPILQEMAARSGFPYPDLDDPLIESILVVADSYGKPIMACAAKKLVELYLFVDPSVLPMTKKSALNALHGAMADSLRALRYNSVECFLPSEISDKFGRRLERTWGWVRNWPSWTRRF